MKYLFLFFIIFIISFEIQAQSEITTEIGYYPEQKPEVPDEDYKKWTYMLENTYQQIAEDSGKLVCIDHLNIATAFKNLKEPKQKVLDQWYLAQKEDIECTAELFPLIYRSSESVAGYLTKSEYNSLLERFTEVMANKEGIQIDPFKYANKNKLNTELVILMARLHETDQAFRMTDMSKQKLIDQQNIQIIDSLFDVHEKYIGNSLVGEEYQLAMWDVIQHSDLEHQEKYLPIIHEEVINRGLPKTPLKMLIDRFYKQKFGYQIFGSQSGCDLADGETIQKVKEEYGL